jgi:hypothetical protein
MGIFDSYNKYFNPYNLANKLNPANKADKYLKDIPGQGHELYDPYINAGKGQIPGLENEYKSLMGNTGDVMKRLGEGYQKSPGFDFAMKQAMQGGNNAAAAGGMAGSPQHEQENMESANNLANQDYNSYLKNAMELYQRGLQGSEGMMSGGRGAAGSLADMLSQNSRDRAGNAASGQDWINQLIMGMAGAGMKGGMM